MIVGHIYRVHTVLVDPPKEKIVLHVGEYAGNPLFLWFNTEARRRPAQMPVTAAEAPGITRDCFLDCGRVTTFSAPELASARHRGAAPSAFLLRVVEEVNERAITLPKAHRTAVVETLRLVIKQLTPK